MPHVNDPVGHALDLGQPLCSQLLVTQDGRDQSSAATVDRQYGLSHCSRRYMANERHRLTGREGSSKGA